MNRLSLIVDVDRCACCNKFPSPHSTNFPIINCRARAVPIQQLACLKGDNRPGFFMNPEKCSFTRIRASLSLLSVDGEEVST